MTDFTEGFTPQTLADDGIQRPSEPDGTSASTASPLDPVQRDLGFILDEIDDEKVAKHVVHLRTEQEPAMSRRRAYWKRNRWWREGKRWVRLTKVENESRWEAKLPPGMGSMPPVPNKTDRLVRRLTNTLLVDPPYPECEPADDTNEARDAAEFATRYLSTKGASSELNMKRLCRAAFDKAATYASGFAWVTMDPAAGGHRPRRMLAHPLATHQDNALEDPSLGQDLGIDGLTQPAEQSDLTERFVRPDGYLTDSPADADLQWMPGPKVRLLTGLQVNFIPETARGMDDAIGVMITDVTTLGDLRTLFPERITELTEEETATLCQWRPDHLAEILPPYTKVPDDQKYEEGPKAGQFKDAQMVVVMTVYYESCAEYPFGCYAVVAGDTLVLHRQRWCATMAAPRNPDGSDGQPTEECLEIPVAQCRCLDDDTTDDPYGVAITEHLGPADEIAASALASQLDYNWRAGNPHLFLPHGSIVQPKQLTLRDGRPIMVNPQGKPEWEQIPALSPSIPNLRVEMQHDMDDATGLQQAAQGVEDPSVQSGIHAQVIVQEALKAVSNMKENIGDFYIAVNRIVLQLTRAFATVPTLLSYTGEDGSYKQREWSREDFRTTRRVSIAKGSFTMHTLAAKQQMAGQMKAEGAIDTEEYVDLMTGGVSPILGLQDNPHLLRVRRQLDAWSDGPPPEWLQAKQQVDAQNQQQALRFQAAQQQYGQMQALASQAPTGLLGPDGMPIAATPAPLPPPPQAPPTIPDPPGPFADRLPIDLEPMPAKIRHRQLSKVMASGRYEAMPDPWKAGFLAEYQEMKNAAGVIVVPEVQQAQAAAAANQPPALPKGVSIAMKGDASTVAAEEQAALTGMQGGAPAPPPSAPGGGAAPQPAPAAPAPPVINIHHHAQPEGAKVVEHIRDGAGRIIASKITPHAPVVPTPPLLPNSGAGVAA